MKIQNTFQDYTVLLGIVLTCYRRTEKEELALAFPKERNRNVKSEYKMLSPVHHNLNSLLATEQSRADFQAEVRGDITYQIQSGITVSIISC